MANASNRLSPADNLPGEGNRAPAGAAPRQPRYSFTRRVFRQAIGIVLATICIVPLALLIWALYDIRFPSTKSVAAKPVLVVRAADGHTTADQSADADRESNDPNHQGANHSRCETESVKETL